MKAKRFTKIVRSLPTIFLLSMLTVMTLFAYLLDASSLSGFSPGFNIRNLVKHTHLIVYGTVVNKEFVFRENINSQYTTDITVVVQQKIKGNVAEGSKIKFMVEGGEGIHPGTGRDLIVRAGHSPRFEIGEQILLFLKKYNRRDMDTPHGGYSVFYGRLGKMQVRDSKVLIPYTFKKSIVDNRDGQLINKEIDVSRSIKLPIDLVINIGKASLRDYDAVVPLEARIRSIIADNRRNATPTITEELVNELNQSANQILERDED